MELGYACSSHFKTSSSICGLLSDCFDQTYHLRRETDVKQHFKFDSPIIFPRAFDGDLGVLPKVCGSFAHTYAMNMWFYHLMEGWVYHLS